MQLQVADIENILGLTQDALAQQVNNPVPDVRKTVVFGLVEVCEAIGNELFTQEVMEKHMSVSQQRLVQIYIERR